MLSFRLKNEKIKYGYLLLDYIRFSYVHTIKWILVIIVLYHGKHILINQ